MLSLLHPYICIVCYVDVILIFNLISCIVFEFLYMFALILFVSMSLVFPQKCYHCNDIFRSSLFLVVISVMLVILWDIVLLVCIILIHTLYIYFLNSFAFFIVFPFAYFHFMSLCSNWPSLYHLNVHSTWICMLIVSICYMHWLFFVLPCIFPLIMCLYWFLFLLIMHLFFILLVCIFLLGANLLLVVFFTLNVWPGFYFILLLV